MSAALREAPVARAPDWPRCALGDLCRIELGSTPARGSAQNWDEDHSSENVWLSIADMPNGLHAVAADSREYVSDAAAVKMRLVPEGTLLVSFKLTLGRLCYAGRDLFTNEAIAALHDIDSSRICKEFLYWYLTYFDWDAAAAGDHKIKGKTLNKAKLKALAVVVPPLEEQERIVAVLDLAFAALDRARAHAEANLADTSELKSRSIERELSSNALGHSEPIGPHVNLLTGFAFKSGGYSDAPHDIRLVRGDNIVQGKFRWEGVKRWPINDRKTYEKYELALDDILIAMDRTWVSAGIKYVIVDDDALPSLLVQRVARLRAKPSIVPRYLGYWIGSKIFERYVLSIQTGLGVPHVSGKQIESFPMRVSAVKDQTAIADRLDAVVGRCSSLAAAYKSKLIDLATLRQSLLQKAFAGELT